MDNNNHSTGSGHGNNFFSGFLLGVLVGAAVIFLLGTKKGKKILKAISEEGAENISHILEKVEKATDLNEVSEDDEEETLPKKEITVKEKSIEEKPRTKRFFRGISRRLN